MAVFTKESATGQHSITVNEPRNVNHFWKQISGGNSLVGRCHCQRTQYGGA